MPEKKTSPLECLIGGVVLVVVLIVVANTCNTSDQEESTKQRAFETTISISDEQAAFVKVVEQFISEYHRAPNELKKSATRTERRKALSQTLKNVLGVHGWTGELVQMGTNSDGKAYVTIRLVGSESTTVMTWNNALSDIGCGTLIDQESPVFSALSGLHKGSYVIFSGTFLPCPRDCLKEGSMTEAGSMLEPEFLMKFSEIQRAGARNLENFTN